MEDNNDNQLTTGIELIEESEGEEVRDRTLLTERTDCAESEAI